MKRTINRFAVGLALAIGTVWVACAGPSAAVADCEALFPARPLPGHPPLPAPGFTTIQDAPAQVTEARVVDAAGDVPAHCRAEGYVSPNVEFVLRLPGSSDWNGNFLEASLGGYGGSTESMAGWCDEALRRGYSCITHDTGHTGIGSRASWAYNNLQAEFDYGIRGHHVAALAGKAITEHYYGRAPKFSYHVGSSGGGKQGMVEANRFPWNFDGILAMVPSSVTASGVMILWNALATHDEDGNPLFTAADLGVLHAGAIAACDADDGLEDGIIGGDPRTCANSIRPHLDLRVGADIGLSIAGVQVEAAKKKSTTGPVTSDRREAQQILPVLSCLARFGEGRTTSPWISSIRTNYVGAVHGVQPGSGTELEGVRLRLGPRLQAHGDDQMRW